MLELLFVVAFFLVLLGTGVSLFGILAALILASVVMMLGGLFALFIQMLPWLLLAVIVVWIVRAIKRPDSTRYYKKRRWRY
ncbi:envelope stress response protein PspG [Siccibacter colletis]|uniref:envelope stress response protein PspG n=1 Tax=Siccibacter colletis TaxID=1505757 RepID=UPI0004E24F01|nr:envelope stress response protein PspG [Siccibacter colletis]WNN48239.1 envelope stress response protein PspG [Siccibacter colletis]